ncbi:MAG: hypothetical protein SGI77_24375 [Pirellulaceae bacterium]|nr:hypothetical protein [Pirellulaceae bacterium]
MSVRSNINSPTLGRRLFLSLSFQIRSFLQTFYTARNFAKVNPSSQEKQSVADWIRAFRQQEALRNEGDPGVVLVRRLNNAEYNYRIRDLGDADKPLADL